MNLFSIIKVQIEIIETPVFNELILSLGKKKNQISAKLKTSPLKCAQNYTNYSMNYNAV